MKSFIDLSVVLDNKLTLSNHVSAVKIFLHKLIKNLRVHAERWNACRSENIKTFMGKPMKHIMKEQVV
jgi:hypothetical protein